MGGSTLQLSPDAFSGRQLGKYEVLCRLSTGGMAEIFLASQRGLAGFRKLVVLKQILPDIKDEDEFVRMFLDEAKVTAAFNHPNIAQVFDLDVAEGELFLAMEFVQGATLVEVAKACRAANEAIPIGLSLASARDTALALHYAHTFKDPLGRPSPVIHRDVAEKNIMVTYEGVTKLLDFGIAKSLAGRSRTQVGMVKGTSGYMSPEQILGEPLDARSDLFSLGVVLHELLTGLRLFHAKTPEAGAGAVLHGQIPPPSRANKAVPPELDAIVLKALARKRGDRYATTLEFARALERAVGPLIWHPEQNGELMQRLFAERREQTRQLLMAGQALSGEATGEVRVSQIFALPSFATPPPAPDPDLTPAGLPAITPALAGRGRAPPPPPEEEQRTQVGPPPAPPEASTRPPTPSRSEPTPRRPTSSGLPAVASAEPLRRPVFEPLPQKRASTSSPVPSELLPPPPPPPEETTNRTQPGNERGRGARMDENATRAAPLEEPRSEGRGRTLSRSEMSAPRPGGSRSEAPPARARSSPVDLHTQGTLPWGEAPAHLQQPQPPGEDGNTVRSARSGRMPTSRAGRTTSSDRLPPAENTVPPRNPRGRAPTPEPEDESSDEQLVTRPVRVLPPPEEEPAADTNETLVPEEEDESAGIVTASHHGVGSKRRGGWLLITLAVLVLLAGAGFAVVALGLDGGRLSALWSPPAAAPQESPQPLAPAKPIPPAAPAPAPTPTVTEESTGSPAPASPSPTEAAPTAEAPATAEAAPPETAPAEPAPSAEAAALQPASAPSEEPEAAPAPIATASEEEVAPSPPTTKKQRPSRRTRKEPKASEAAPVDNDWAPMDNKPGASTASPGNLTLVTEPYAKVYAGKRFLGETPLFKVSFPAGRHLLRLVGPGGQNLKLSVEINPGETTAVRVPLEQLPSE